LLFCFAAAAAAAAAWHLYITKFPSLGSGKKDSLALLASRDIVTGNGLHSG